MLVRFIMRTVYTPLSGCQLQKVIEAANHFGDAACGAELFQRVLLQR